METRLSPIGELNHTAAIRPMNLQDADENISYRLILKITVAANMLLNRNDSSERSRSVQGKKRDYYLAIELSASSTKSSSWKRFTLSSIQLVAGIGTNIFIPSNDNRAEFFGRLLPDTTTNKDLKEACDFFLKQTFPSLSEMFTLHNSVDGKKADAQLQLLTSEIQEISNQKQAAGQANIESLEILKAATHSAAKAASGAGG